jgi:hypothetical protein
MDAAGRLTPAEESDFSSNDSPILSYQPIKKQLREIKDAEIKEAAQICAFRALQEKEAAAQRRAYLVAEKKKSKRSDTSTRRPLRSKTNPVRTQLATESTIVALAATDPPARAATPNNLNDDLDEQPNSSPTAVFSPTNATTYTYNNATPTSSSQINISSPVAPASYSVSLPLSPPIDPQSYVATHTGPAFTILSSKSSGTSGTGSGGTTHATSTGPEGTMSGYRTTGGATHRENRASDNGPGDDGDDDDDDDDDP